MSKWKETFSSKTKRITVIFAAVIALLLSVGLFREVSLGHAQRVFSTLLEENAGHYNEGRLVLSSTDSREAQKIADALGGSLRITKTGQFALVTLPDGVTLADVAENRELRQYMAEFSLDYNNFRTFDREIVEEAEVRANYQVSDPMYPQQTYLDYINIGDAWNVSTGRNVNDEKVTVAIIDSGIDTDHPEFTDADGNSIISTLSYDATNDKVADRYNITVIEDTYGHGTAVAGVIAAQMNDIGTAGISPDVELLVIKCEVDKAGEFTSSADIVFGIYYAIEQDVDVINMSFGGDGSKDMAHALQLAVDSDIICVAAAGNDSTDQPHYPAAYDMVVGVGAMLDGSWKIAEYSNYGINSDIMAPGTALTTAMGGGYTYENGTSIAAPIVASAAALYKAQDPYATCEKLKVDLLASGKDLGDAGEDDVYGFGALDMNAFLCEEKGILTYDYCTEELANTTQVFVRQHTIQTVPEPERENIIFDDWYYDKTYTRVFDYDAWYTTEFVEDVTLYAKWANEDDEDDSVYSYRTLSDGTVEIVSYKGKRRYLTIPNELDGKVVSSIGSMAFAGNTRLREVVFPEGLVSIKNGAFDGVGRMRKITFTGTQLTDIQEKAFYNCSALRTLELPDSVQTIGKYAFAGSVDLTTVSIGENSRLTTMEEFAFSQAGISEFYLPRNVKINGFDGSVLAFCSNMRSIAVHAENSAFAIDGNTLYSADKTRIIYYPASLTGSYKVRDGVDRIGTYAFAASNISGIDLNAVTGIDESAFDSSKGLTAVVIPDTVVSMEAGAFHLSALKQVTLSENLSELTDSVFSGTKLTSIYIPNAIQTIQSSALSNCGYLSQLTFAPDAALQSIESSAFENCYLLAGFQLPESLSRIGERAFRNCSSITTLTIPANVASIGSEAFRFCGQLRQVTFAKGCILTQIPSYCFANCTALNTVAFSDLITELGEYAFSNDYLLQSLNFGEERRLASVGDYCFNSCSALQTMQLPDTVTDIGQFAYAFSGLTEVDLSENVTSVGNAAFGACYMLDTITVDGNNAVYSAVDHVLFSKAVDTVYCVPASRAGSYTLPETVKITAPYSFYYDSYLTAVVLPEGLEDIQMNSFYNCSHLSAISIPANVTNIGRKAFENCKDLNDVTFAENSKLQRLGINTFVNCGFTEITIPASVESIAQYVFCNCDNLRTLRFEQNSNLSYVAAYLLKGTRVESVVFENGSALTSLQAHAFDGAKYLKSVDFGDATVTNVDNYAFYGCSNLESITLPADVTYIGRHAFYDCEKLDRMDIPAAVDHIGESAFFGTNEMKIFFVRDELPANVQIDWDKGIAGYFLGSVDYVVTDEWEYSVRRNGTIALAAYKGTDTELTIDTVDGYTVSRIGTGCFHDNDTLTGITLSDHVTEIGNYAFCDCDALKGIAVPASVERIGKYAFADSETVVTLFEGSTLKIIDSYAFSGNVTTALSLPDSVTAIGDGAFYGSGLTTLAVGDGSVLTSIGQEAFVGSGITEIRLPASLKTVGTAAFKDVTALTSVEIAGGKTALKLSNSAFEGSGIQQISIPARVNYIGEYALGSCTELERIHVDSANTAYRELDGILLDIAGTTLIQYPGGRSGAYEVPEQIKVLSYASFKNAKGLTEVTFAEGSTIRTIGWQTFSGCDSLTKITIPNSVVSFDYYAFENCTALTDVILGWGSRLSGVYEGVFYNCTALEHIQLPYSVVEIGDHAFYGCRSLTRFPLTKNALVRGIYDHAFDGCTGITEIPEFSQLVEIGEFAFSGTNISTYTVSCNLKEIAANAFDGCVKFTSISCDENHPDFTAIDGVLYEKGVTDTTEYDALVIWPYAKTLLIGEGKTEITAADTDPLKDYPMLQWKIADSVTKIGEDALREFKFLKSITIPEQITTIERGALCGCWSVENIYFNAVNMDDCDWSSSLFAGAGMCTDGVTLTIGANVTKIPAYSFSRVTNLKSVVFEEGSRCESIRKYAFSDCRNLVNMMIPQSITAIGDAAFQDCPAILIFESDVLPPTLGTGWSGMTSIVVDPDEYGVSEDNYFYCITKQGTAILGRYCGNESDIAIPEQIHGAPVEMILGTFSEYLSLKHVTIPDRVTQIGAYSFYNCKGLTSISIPENIKSIGNYAFAYCTSVENLYFNAAAMEDLSEYNYVFYSIGTDGRGVEVVIGSSVTSIPGRLFRPDPTIHAPTDPNVRTVSFEEGSVCTTIRNGAFAHCTSLSSITIPKTVQNISVYAFYACDALLSAGPVGSGCDYEFEWTQTIPAGAFGCIPNLSRVIIPEGISSISGAFSSCHNLRYVSLPESLKSGSSSLGSCKSLKTVGPVGSGCNIEFGWKDSIPAQAFSDSRYLQQVVLPEGLTAIEASAFSNCSALTSVLFPASVATIGDNAFSGCGLLQNITLPEELEKIGSHAFFDCKSLSSVVIPAQVEEIGAGAFASGVQMIMLEADELPTSCGTDWSGSALVILNPREYGTTADGFLYCVENDGMTIVWGYTGTSADVEIPGTISGYPVDTLIGTFQSRTDITSVVVPESVTKIGKYTFYNCSTLKAITLPDSLTDLESHAFYGCTALESVVIPENVTQLEDYVFYGCSALKTVTLPEHLTSLGDYVFYECAKLRTVELPGGVTDIGQYAFYNCTSLEKATIPQGITKIRHYTFYGCKNLTELVLPEAITRIESNAFCDCTNLPAVTIHENVTFIGKFAFFGCTGLRKIQMLSDLVNLDPDVFRDCSGIYSAGPLGGGYDYEFVWTVSIPDYAFADCDGLSSVTLPDSLIRLGDYAFEGCSGLRSIKLPDSLVHIGNYAFDACQKLTGITIPDGVDVIRRGTFSSCIDLTEVIIPDTVISIEASAFHSCLDLKTIDLPQKLMEIGSSAFNGCSGLKRISIPASVISIDENAFNGCIDLDVVYLDSPYVAASVNSDTDSGALTKYATAVLIPSGVEDVGSYITTNFTYTEDIFRDETAYIMRSEYSIGWEPAETVSTYEPCVQDGVYVYQCTTCDVTKTVTESAHDYLDTVVQHATCVDPGIGNRVCVRCAYSTPYEIPSPGYHSMGAWHDNAEGTLQRDCATCNYAETGSFSVIDSGTCGEKMTWTITSDGTLWITGKGAMTDWIYSSVWHPYRDKITAIRFDGPITSIGSYAFYGLALLTKVEVPNTVVSIGDDAFRNCRKLSEVTISERVSRIGSSVFFESDNLNAIWVDADNPYFLSDEQGVLYNKSKTMLIQAPCTLEGVYAIPDSVISIGQKAFRRCSTLTGITMSDRVTTIGSSAFSHCSSLTSIVLSDRITIIDYELFSECSSLRSITLPDSVTTIGTTAFFDCSGLAYVSIPKSVTTIGNSAFDLRQNGVIVASNFRDIYYPGSKQDWDEIDYNRDRNATLETAFIHCGITDPSEHPYTPVISAPTCTEPGHTTWSCDCGYRYQEESPGPLGHEYRDGTCIRCGEKAPVEFTNPFTDVPSGSFYYESVMWAVAKGITNGTTPTTFGPNDQCMRAHVVTFLWRAVGSPEPTRTDNPFVDVKETDFYYKAVMWALENGITSGMDATHFGPFAYCNRAQVVTFLHRTMGIPEVESASNPFTDVAPGAFYEKAVLWAVENGITYGLSATAFGPTAICNRAQIVTFLYRAFVTE